ncbi:hypothetical protein C8E00_102539 [Chromohalobacter marismortui]|uniref:EamA-like transporter family protein n=1 Tax=Chromohalobacter marismortui TaxID=42055 RepID=A0A4V3F493_9GAMM|nr:MULTISPECIES: DMT family transporter [Chromohalobacter]MCI0509073.1 DMT family transporter [Chromohalobacter sp.]MCI0592822.1 DMT family transporter [Chromohalobacter sp.]TDU24036.1 hypothetical protein C8E00_102539 [Chromohalobacter marismortui]
MACSALQRKGTFLPEWRALGCLLLVGTLLAMSYVVAKQAEASGMPKLHLLVVSMAGAGLVLLGIARLQHRTSQLSPRLCEYALVSGMLLAFPNAMGFLAIRHVGAGFVSLSLAFPILITWLLVVMLRLEPLIKNRLLGVLFGLAGGVLLTLGKASGIEGSWGWAAIVLAMPAVIAFGNVYRTLRWRSQAEPVFLAALMLLGAGASLLPFATVFESGRAVSLIATKTSAWLVLELIAVYTVLYLFFFLLQRLAGPVYFSQIGTVAALVGSGIAILALGETLPNYLGPAAALIGLGTILFHRGARLRRTKPSATTT